MLDLARERALQALLVELADRGQIETAHDCAEGGLAVTLAECCFNEAGVGAEVNLPTVDAAGDWDQEAAVLFSESASRVIVSAAPDKSAAILSAAAAAGVPAARCGRTGGASIRIAIDGHVAIDVAIVEAEARWSGTLKAWLDGRAA